jgi:hypothetical protein
MIKLLNILSEIRINKPGIPKFKNNDELANYLKKNSLGKKRLIDLIWDDPEWDRQGEGWEDVLNGWYNADIIQYSNYNEEDEIMIDDDNDNRVYISIVPLPYDPGLIDHKVEFGLNTIYWQYF